MDEDSVLQICQFVKMKGKLRKDALKHEIVSTVSEKLKQSIPQLAAYAFSTELHILIGRIVENCVEKRHELDKKEVAVAILQSVFPLLTAKDVEVISENLDALHGHGLFRRASYLKRLLRYVWPGKKKG